MSFDLGARFSTFASPTRHRLAATPDTCYWGYIDRDQPPCLVVDDGDVIEVQAVTHHAGDAPDLLMDEGITAIWDSIAEDTRGPGVHILTGPIHVRGAEPGDTLAVEIISMTPRMPYGSHLAANWGLLFDTYQKE
ncbi:MAG: acetamidase/formamidase family protein, partial [Ilumatobacteraceae bacterium]